MTQLSGKNTASSVPISPDVQDADLMAHLAAGEPVAMEILYDRYSRQVFSFAYRMMGDRDHAEDVMQEVFLRAWRRSSRFSDARGSLISWLLSITHNMSIDELRKKQRRPQKAQSAEPEFLMNSLRDPDESVEDRAVASDKSSIIRSALTEIPANQREVLELGYFRGMTQVEISNHLSVPLGTVKTRMRLALRKLQELGEIQALVHHDED